MADEPSGRTPDGRFKPGFVANPRGPRRMPDYLREMYEGATPKAVQRLSEALDATKLVGQNCVEHPDWAQRIKAAEVIIERLYGKPVQEIAGEDGGPIRVDMGMLEKLQTLIQR